MQFDAITNGTIQRLHETIKLQIEATNRQSRNMVFLAWAAVFLAIVQIVVGVIQILR